MRKLRRPRAEGEGRAPREPSRELFPTPPRIERRATASWMWPRPFAIPSRRPAQQPVGGGQPKPPAWQRRPGPGDEIALRVSRTCVWRLAPGTDKKPAQRAYTTKFPRTKNVDAND